MTPFLEWWMVPTNWPKIKGTAAIFCERGSLHGNAVSTHTWKRRDLRDEREASGMRGSSAFCPATVSETVSRCAAGKKNVPVRVKERGDEPLGFKYSPSNQFVKLEAGCYMCPIKGVNTLGLVGRRCSSVHRELPVQSNKAQPQPKTPTFFTAQQPAKFSIQRVCANKPVCVDGISI